MKGELGGNEEAMPSATSKFSVHQTFLHRVDPRTKSHLSERDTCSTVQVSSGAWFLFSDWSFNTSQGRQHDTIAGDNGAPLRSGELAKHICLAWERQRDSVPVSTTPAIPDWGSGLGIGVCNLAGFSTKSPGLRVPSSSSFHFRARWPEAGHRRGLWASVFHL